MSYKVRYLLSWSAKYSGGCGNKTFATVGLMRQYIAEYSEGFGSYTEFYYDPSHTGIITLMEFV